MPRPLPLTVISFLHIIFSSFLLVGLVFLFPVLAIDNGKSTDLVPVVLSIVLVLSTGIGLWKMKLIGFKLFCLEIVYFIYIESQTLYNINKYPWSYNTTMTQQLIIASGVALVLFIALGYLISIRKILK